MSEKVQEFCTDFENYCKTYSDLSHLHGVRRIAEPRSITEKVFWTIVSAVALALCLSVISHACMKFIQSPTVVGYANQETSISKLPFPVVTICPESKIKPIFSYSNISFDLAENSPVEPDDLIKYQYFYSFCDQNYPYKDFGPDFYNDTFFSTINDYKRDLDEFLVHCRFMGKTINCQDYFHPVLLKQGVCFSFNSVDKRHIFRSNVDYCCGFFTTKNTGSDWDPRYGYRTKNVDTYPRRALFSGADNALLLNLKLDQDTTAPRVCKSSMVGYRIFTYSSAEVPSSEMAYVRAPLGHAVNIAILPVNEETAQEVDHIHWSRRGCFNEGDRYLKFFKFYTSDNCQLECLTNYTFLQCNCVAFYMPRTASMPVCGGGSYSCVKLCERRLFRMESGSRLTGNHSYSRSYCNCLPGCSKLNYIQEVSASGWYFREYASRHPQYMRHLNISANESMTQVRVYFKKGSLLDIYRSDLRAWYEVLAKLGAILNLFLGISVISVLEILYFFTVRIFGNESMYKRWAGPKDQDIWEEVEADAETVEEEPDKQPSEPTEVPVETDK